MAGNNGGSNNRSNGASISAAATAIGSSETRFLQPEGRRRWVGCWGGLSCFGSQKGGRRIVPASRIPEGNTSANRANGPQPVGLNNQATTIAPSLLAPPSSPASFTNSRLPSTAQSPSNFLSLSANSPGGPSSTMFATGPYAHETQLVSPPVPSTFTTEPSTAPFTPPPELAHLTTPSSPDVPFAQFLSSSSSMGLKSAGKSSYVHNDLQATYPLYPGSPASNLISPVSGTTDGFSSSFPNREPSAQRGASVSPQNPQNPQNRSFGLFGLDSTTSKNFMLSQDSSFFCPATSAQFYLDQAQQSFPSYSHSGGRLSFSREADVYSSSGNGHQNRPGKSCKPDVEEIEAYRASFGFSADEIITTPHYVEISDVLEDSFTMKPFAEESTIPELPNRVDNTLTTETNLLNYKGLKLTPELTSGKINAEVWESSCNGYEGCKSEKGSKGENGYHILTDDDEEENIFSKMGDSKSSKRIRVGVSTSDAEIDYRRGGTTSLRQPKPLFN